MKIVANFFKFIVIMAIAAVVAIATSLTVVFFVSRETPDEIFIMGYAMATDVDESGKRSLWLIEQADVNNLNNGDGVVYYDGSYCAANVMVKEGQEPAFYPSSDLDPATAVFVAVDDENLVGKIIAMWQQK